MERSPLFQLSLSSKELFHSNFLFWLIDTYKDQCTEIFSKFLVTKMKNLVITNVFREKENRDLTIIFTNKEKEIAILVIENKVKSIPYLAQLEKYTKSDPNESYLLLSLSKPTFLNAENQIYISDLDKVWKYINYEELSKLLTDLLPIIKKESEYHEFLLKDYILFISSFSQLFTEYTKEINTYDFYNPQKIKVLNKLRIHDVFLKYQHIQLGIAVIQKIKDKNNEPLFEMVGNDLRVEQSFTRGTGITDFKFNITGSAIEPILLGIQIQGMTFKIFLEELEGNAEELAYQIFESDLWFNFDLVPETVSDKIKIMPQKVKFNKYDNTFRYRYIKLKECDIDDLVETIYGYLVYIVNNREDIMELIN